MEVRCSLKRFKPCGQAVAIFEKIEMANKLDALESYLEELYGDSIDGGTLNDLLAYENEDILAALGLAKPEEMEESLKESNMSYCRFRNTLEDLKDCQNALYNSDISSDEEAYAAKRLIEICKEIADDYENPEDVYDMMNDDEDLEESFNISKMNKLLETALNEDLCYVFDFEIDGDTIYCKNEFGYDIELDINEEDAEDAYIIEQEIEEQMDEEANNIAEDDTEITGTEIVCFKYDVKTKKGSFELVIFTEDEDNIDESLNEDSIINKFKEMANKILADFKAEGYPKSEKYLLDFVDDASKKFSAENKGYFLNISTDNGEAVITLCDTGSKDDGSFYQARINGYGKGKVRFTDLENSNYAYESLNEDLDTKLDFTKSYVIVKRINQLDISYHAKGLMDHEKAMDMDSDDRIPLVYKTKRSYFNELKYLQDNGKDVFFSPDALKDEYNEYKEQNKDLQLTGYFDESLPNNKFISSKTSMNESLNESKLWYIGWRSNPQLKNGGYWKKFGQLTKAEAKKWEKPGYGDMSLTGYETEEEYNKALEEKGLK